MARFLHHLQSVKAASAGDWELFLDGSHELCILFVAAERLIRPKKKAAEEHRVSEVLIDHQHDVSGALDVNTAQM